jgi:hypothetical protein
MGGLQGGQDRDRDKAVGLDEHAVPSTLDFADDQVRAILARGETDLPRRIGGGPGSATAREAIAAGPMRLITMPDDTRELRQGVSAPSHRDAV